MITVSKNVLKAKMLEYFRRVEDEGEELVVTHHRVPVLKVIPIHKPRETVEDLFAQARSKARIGPAALAPTRDEWPEA